MESGFLSRKEDSEELSIATIEIQGTLGPYLKIALWILEEGHSYTYNIDYLYIYI